MLAFSYYSFDTYSRWRNKPIILGFDEQLTEIYEIPLPAVILNLKSVQLCTVVYNSQYFLGDPVFKRKV
jgi:hypothetical protein